MVENQTFGSLIALRRKELNLSQRALAEKIKTESKPSGVWSTYIGQVEKGDRVPSSEVCEALAEILQLNPLLLLALVYKFKASTQAELELAEILISAISLASGKGKEETLKGAVKGLDKKYGNMQKNPGFEELYSVVNELLPENIRLVTNVAVALREKQNLQ